MIPAYLLSEGPDNRTLSGFLITRTEFYRLSICTVKKRFDSWGGSFVSNMSIQSAKDAIDTELNKVRRLVVLDYDFDGTRTRT